MLYDVETPSEFLDAIEEEWKKDKILRIRQIITDKNSSIKESIEYKMLCFTLNDTSIFHLNAQKNYVSLYVGDIRKVESGEELLVGLDTGKGCVRIKKSVQIEDTKLDQFIINTIQMVESNKDIGC